MKDKMSNKKLVKFSTLNVNDEFMMNIRGKFVLYVKTGDTKATEVKDVNPLTVDIPKPWKEIVFVPA
jgi:tRNA A58 N-methylase Trm61